MRILLLASRVPYPLHNGEDLRIFHFTRYLSRRHELHLLAFGSDIPPPPEVACFFRCIHTVEPKPIHAPIGTSLARLIHVISPDHMYYFDPQISSKVSALLKENSFDLVWIPAWQMIPYLREIRDVPVLVDVMDDGVLELARDLRWNESLQTAVINLKRLLVTYLFERRYLSRASLCVLVTERDAEVLRWVCPKAKAVVIPNGVDSDYFQPLGLAEDFPSLIFEGNMSFSPSVDAVSYFCREVFPLIQMKVPQVKFYIVGKEPLQEVRALANDRIIVTGFVGDVRPYLDRASVFVCPMRKGAGIKNKVLQAWAMGKPVVSTSIALAGLDAQPGENIMVADTPEQFAAQVIQLLENQSLRQTVGRQAMATVRKGYTWQQQAKQLESALESL